LIPLPNGGELLLSWSRLVTPRGWPIQDVGVLPHLCTSLGLEAAAQALAALGRGEAPMRAALERQRALRAPVAAAAAAELRAACPPAEAREAEFGVARALIDSPDTWRAALGP
ncbi:MAG TPA: hypothetical protein VEA40_28020, partial [Ramlibacter sp.]|nr:hypothetical protein [Ramlibacter sp.]